MICRATVLLMSLLLIVGLSSCFLGKYGNVNWSENDWLRVPAPDSTLEYPNSPEYYETEYVGYDGVYIDRHYSVKHLHRSRSGWSQFEVSKQRYIVLNPEIERLTTFRLKVDPQTQTLDSVYLSITEPGVSTQYFGFADLIEESVSPSEVVYKHVYPNVKKGVLIEEGYICRTTGSKQPITPEYFHALNTDLPAENVSYKFTFPLKFELSFKRSAVEISHVEQFAAKQGSSPDTVVTIQRTAQSSIASPFGTLKMEKLTNYSDGTQSTDFDYRKSPVSRTYVATGKNVPAWPDEPWSPYKLEVAPYLKFMITSTGTSSKENDQPATFDKLFQGLRLKYGPIKRMRESVSLRELTKSLTENAETNFAKAAAINSWVQQNLTVGDFGRRGDDYQRILATGEGSFQYIMEMTMAMMYIADLDARMIMIHSAREGNFDPDYITFEELSPPGILVSKGSDTLVVFPQIKHLQAGLLPAAWQSRPAIYIETYYNTSTAISPRTRIEENTQEEEYELTIANDGLISVKEVKYFRGLSAYYMRATLEDMKASEQDDAMKELLTYDDGDVKLGKYEIENQDDNRQPLVITFYYTIDNLVTVTPDEVVFQTGGLFSPSSELKTKVETDDRTNPIRIYSDELIKKRISINYPSEWQLDTDLKPINFSNVFGELEATYSNEPGRLFVEQRRLLEQASQPKEQIHELLKITGRESQLYVPTLIFAVK